MSTSLCQLQKASCLAEEPLVPDCRQGPYLTPAYGPHTHTHRCEQNETGPPPLTEEDKLGAYLRSYPYGYCCL